MKLVLVEWHDAHAETETWIDLDTVGDDGPYVVRSAGWLLPKNKRKKKHVTLAMSVSADGYVDSVLHIPNKMVVQITVLSEVADEIIIPGSTPNAEGSRHDGPLPKKSGDAGLGRTTASRQTGRQARSDRKTAPSYNAGKPLVD